jgi:hypothetical protein
MLINIISVVVYILPLLFETYKGISARTITAAITKGMHKMQHIAKIGPPPGKREFLKKSIEVNKITSNIHRQSIHLDLD